MTPSEKAQQLVDKYRIVLMSEDTDCGNEILCTSIAIKTALIALDDIIQMSDKNKIVYSFYENNCLTQYTEDFYWNKVKQELEKL